MNLKNDICEFNNLKNNIENKFEKIVEETLDDKGKINIRINDKFLCVEIVVGEYTKPNSFFFEKMNEIGYYELTSMTQNYNNTINLIFERSQLN